MDAPLRHRAPTVGAILMLVALLATLTPAAAARGPVAATPAERAPAAATGLTGPSDASPAEVALAYVRANARDFGLNARQVDDLYVHRELRLSTGATAVHLGQRVAGLRVRDAILTAVVAADGRLLSVDGFLAAGRGGGAARLTAREALDIAADRQGARASRRLVEADDTKAARRTFPNVYARGVHNATPVSAELVWFAADRGRALRLAWLTDIESSGQAWYETVVDAQTGRSSTG